MDDEAMLKAIRRRFIYNNILYVVDFAFVLACMFFIMLVAIKILISSGVLKVL